MKRYKSESTFVTTGLVRVVSELRLMESRVNAIPGRGSVDVGPLVRYFQARQNPRIPFDGDTQFWSEGRATPTFRTFREGVRVCGAAWWLSPGRYLHMRVVGSRIFAANVNALKRAVYPWGLSDRQAMAAHPLAFVYPQLWQPMPSAREPGVLAECRRQLNADPLDFVTWYVMADWWLDLDSTVSADAVRAAGNLAHCIALGAYDGEREPERTGEE